MYVCTYIIFLNISSYTNALCFSNIFPIVFHHFMFLYMNIDKFNNLLDLSCY